ncbi:MAG: hypothetical protein EOO77_44200 [Oxalobacteraceae bacterium]|nr:MAG: hypothetical protein EOO77_44200 [Oxalobacteraceae bacterium]
MTRSRNRGPFKQEWVSICSKHMQDYDEACPRCRAGSWRSTWVRAVDTFLYRHVNTWWVFWHNRPNSRPPYVAKNLPEYQVMNAEYERMNKYRVFVVPTDEIWTYRAMDSDSLTDVIPNWMIEQGITMNWTWQHEYVDEVRAWRLVFRFEHEDVAFRFKMRWG